MAYEDLCPAVISGRVWADNYERKTNLWRFQRDGVHAMATADVPRIQPVYFQAPCGSVFPTEEV